MSEDNVCLVAMWPTDGDLNDPNHIHHAVCVCVGLLIFLAK